MFFFSSRKFSKSIFDVRELFSTDEIAYKSLGKFGNYLREIQTLFSVKEKEISLILINFLLIRIYLIKHHIVF